MRRYLLTALLLVVVAGPACAQDSGGPSAWFSADYLLWRIKPGPNPTPLLTTGPLTDNVPSQIGQPNTQILFGGSDLNYGTASGLRLTAGFWLDDTHLVGGEVSYFQLSRRTVRFSAASDASGNPVLSQPFIDPTAGGAGAESIYSVAFPDPFFTNSGTFFASSSTRLWGIEASLAGLLVEQGRLSLVGLLGYRHLQLAEDLQIGSDVRNDLALLDPDTGDVVGTATSFDRIRDSFSTRNQFHGGQVGLRLNYEGDWLSVGLVGKVALGDMHETIRVTGSTTTTQADGTTTSFPAGILAVASNSGKAQRDQFAAVSEVGGTVGFRPTSWLKLTAGYTFLYVNNVVRPGNQIDRVINPAQVPIDPTFGAGTGPARPQLPFQRSDFYAQGVTFGVELSY